MGLKHTLILATAGLFLVACADGDKIQREISPIESADSLKAETNVPEALIMGHAYTINTGRA